MAGPKSYDLNWRSVAGLGDSSGGLVAAMMARSAAGEDLGPGYSYANTVELQSNRVMEVFRQGFSNPSVKESFAVLDAGGAATASQFNAKDVMTVEGRARILKALAAAEATAKEAGKAASQLERNIRKDVDLAKSRKASPSDKAKAAASVGVMLRELMDKRAAEQRAKGVVATIKASRSFWSMADRSRKPAEKERRLGQAAAALVSGMEIARTKVEVALPRFLQKDQLKALAVTGGIPVNGLGGIGDLWSDIGKVADTVVNTAKDLVPSHTVVGKLLGGGTTAAGTATPPADPDAAEVASKVSSGLPEQEIISGVPNVALFAVGGGIALAGVLFYALK